VPFRAAFVVAAAMSHSDGVSTSATKIDSTIAETIRHGELAVDDTGRSAENAIGTNTADSTSAIAIKHR
jgi:hypothetical protein